jgi:hypothetical protein
MKLYKLFFILLFVTSALKAETINEALTGVKRQFFGSSLVPINDPRVIALMATGVVTVCAGALIGAALWSDNEKSKELGLLQKIVGSLTADGFILGGFLEILFARALVTAIDEASHQMLQEWNKHRYQ